MIKNLVQIETRTGIKDFELFHGDITNLPFPVDLIAISAFKDHYKPTPLTIIGQFHDKQVYIEKLSKDPLFNFKDSLGLWISKDLIDKNFKKIICLELVGNSYSFQNAIKNMFSAISIMEIQGYENQILALPLLGTGLQNFETSLVIQTLIEESLDFLKFSRVLKKVIFVVFSDDNAQDFDIKMDEILGRNKIITIQKDFAKIVLSDLIKTINEIIDDDPIFLEYREIIKSNYKFFIFAAMSRKVLEFIIGKIAPETNSIFELSEKIKKLTEKRYAEWLRHYMHLIRVFGNEAVHSSNNSRTNPKYVESKDFEVGIYCMLRILEFYIQFKKSKTTIDSV